MQAKRVLGIDPGLATVGYAVVESDNRTEHKGAPASGGLFHLLEGGVITTPADWDMSIRLKHLYEETCALIAEHQPHALAIEKLFFKKNVTTGISVAQARGVLLMAGCDLSISEYTPLEIKRRVAGSGKAQKVQIQAMVQRLLGLRQPPRPDDAADAVAVALCCLMEQRTKVS